MSFSPLFVAGTARGGTNLAIMMASAHPGVALVQDPFLAILKSLRNAAVGAGVTAFDPGGPLDEYYYYPDKLDVMRTVQACRLDLPVPPPAIQAIQAQLIPRMKLSAPLLVPYVERIRGPSHKDLLDRGLETIAEAKRRTDAKWVGFNDNWAIEFFGPLARAYPRAKFVAIIRDVRSALASHLRIVESQHRNPLYAYPKDPSMVAMALSFIRCWRKHVAFAAHYQCDPAMAGRVHVMQYERLVASPEQEMQSLCRFLEIDYRPEMVDSSKLIAGDGNVWIPNSNHQDAPQGGIYKDTVGKWRTTLPDAVKSLVGFVAGEDLALAGYEAEPRFRSGELPLEALDWHAHQVRTWPGGGMGWRTDNDDPIVDFAFELMRRAVLGLAQPSDNMIERMFLFPDVFESLRSGRAIGYS